MPLQFLVSCFLKPPVNRWVAVGATEGLWQRLLPSVSWRLYCLLRLSSYECTWGYPSGWRFFVTSLLCAKDQAMKTVSTGQAFSRFPNRLWRGSARFSHCFFLPSFSSCLHLCHCLIGQVIIFPFWKVVFETVYLRLSLKPTWQGLCAMLNHSVLFNWDLSPAKTQGAWFQDPVKLRLLVSHRKRNSVRDIGVGERQICSDSERSTAYRMCALTESECGGHEMWG